MIGTSLQAGVLCSMLGRVVSWQSGLTVLHLTLCQTLGPAQAMRFPLGAPAQSPSRSLGLLSGIGKGKKRLGQSREGWSKTHLRCLLQARRALPAL